MEYKPKESEGNLIKNMETSGNNQEKPEKTTNPSNIKDLNRLSELRNKFQRKRKPMKGFPCKFYFLLVIIFVFIIIIHIFKPVCTILELIFLTRLGKTPRSENEEGLEDISKTKKIFGYLIIFLLPLVNFFITGISIISIQKGIVLKIYVLILVLIEIIFQLPLTFLYTNNLHSLFLFDQRGIEQILNPWVIFFPSDYLLSFFENIRQIVDSVYFFVFGLILYQDIKGNKYRAFNMRFLMCMIVLCCIRFITALALLTIRVVHGNSVTKLKKNSNSSKEIELEELSSKKEEFTPFQSKQNEATNKTDS